MDQENNGIKLAITGRMRSGKDSAANYLADMYDFTSFAFGDALKDLYHDTFPWVPREPKPRADYQKFGQIMRKEFEYNVWVFHCLTNVRRSQAERVVVTDLRQPNEYFYLRSEGFKLIRISAPDDLRLARMESEGDVFTSEELMHETETYTEQFEVDFEITNDGDIFDLYRRVDAVMDELGVKRWEPTKEER